MTRHTSIQLREMILRLWKQGKSFRTIASIMGIGKSMVNDFLTKYRSGYGLKDKLSWPLQHLNSVRRQPILHYIRRVLEIVIMLEHPFFRHKAIRIWKEIVYQHFLILRAVNYSFNEDKWTKSICWKYPQTSTLPPPCLTVGIWYLLSCREPTGRRTYRLPLLPNKQLRFIQKSDSSNFPKFNLSVA